MWLGSSELALNQAEGLTPQCQRVTYVESPRETIEDLLILRTYDGIRLTSSRCEGSRMLHSLGTIPRGSVKRHSLQMQSATPLRGLHPQSSSSCAAHLVFGPPRTVAPRHIMGRPCVVRPRFLRTCVAHLLRRGAQPCLPHLPKGIMVSEKLTSAAAAMIHGNGGINSGEGGSHRNHIRNGCRSRWLQPFAFKSEDAARLENMARGIGLVSSLRVAR